MTTYRYRLGDLTETEVIVLEAALCRYIKVSGRAGAQGKPPFGLHSEVAMGLISKLTHSGIMTSTSSYCWPNESKDPNQELIDPAGQALFLEMRAAGMLLGLACGDAVGAPVEFKRRGTFPLITDMRSGGKFRLHAGEWTDDTSMALCLADSLLACQGSNPEDQMMRYRRWVDTGYRSCRPHPIGIGKTILKSLVHFQRTGEVFAGSTEPKAAGNGALMRLAPVVLYYCYDRLEALKQCVISTRTTHGADECIAASILFGSLLFDALHGKEPATDGLLVPDLDELIGEVPERIAAINRGDWRTKHRDDIVGSGYVVESLEAALWCFYHTNSFETAILMAVNLGDDADTTAAICGQLAGAVYMDSGMPKHWLKRLALSEEIESLALQLIDHEVHAQSEDT